MARTLHIGIIVISTIVAVLSLGLLPHPAAVADSKTEQELQLKAAFIYNFSKFVEWPASSFQDGQTPITVCIIGNDPVKSALDDLKNKRVEGRPVVVKKISSVEQAAGCHILFICDSEKGSLPQILKAVAKMSILTVGDTKGFANSGVMINLVLIDNKMGFEINPAEADHASLKISSKLLKLGKIVK